MLAQAPAMSDPGRFRTLMYEAFWLGKQAELTAEERQAQAENTNRTIGTPASQTELAAVEELRARAAKLREEADK